MNFGSKEKTMTAGEVHDIQLFVKGDIRSDGWISPWRKEQERRRKEELGERKFVTAPQIVARQERKARPASIHRIKIAPRTCDICPSVIRHDNKTGRCVHHPPVRVHPIKALCPCCGAPLRANNTFGICTKCYDRYRRMIHQDPLRVCDECPTRIRPNNATGKCTKHAYQIWKRNENAARRAKHRAMRELERAA